MSDLVLLHAVLLWAAPLLWLLGACLPSLMPGSPDSVWRRLRIIAAAGLAVALAVTGWLAVDGAAVIRGPLLAAFGEYAAIHLSLRADAVGATMLVLVNFIGWVVVAYSRHYMAGDPGVARYQRWLMATLAAVNLLVIANNLLIVVLAWIATSLALHRLLIFYGDRPAALLAAHKKFVSGRIADVCFLTATALIGAGLGTLEIDEIVRRLAAAPEASSMIAAAAFLFAVGAVLRCAQLPAHGWLIQVMEAPTPVSALLHAGVVNLAGFMLIRLAPIFSDASWAQNLLIVAGSVTAVVASLVMTTRISIKVMLAWSTCAQMGFMLMQCGLGAYAPALLHLVGHSLYKAHAFLRAPSAVDEAKRWQMLPRQLPVGLGAIAGGVVLGVIVVGLAWLAWGTTSASAGVVVSAMILVVAVAPRFTDALQQARAAMLLGVALGASILSLVYVGLYRLFAELVDQGGPPMPASDLQIAWVIACFAILFIVQALVRAYPGGGLARRLYPPLFAGLYLDDWLTRWTWRVWPVRRPSTDVKPQAPAYIQTEAPDGHH